MASVYIYNYNLIDLLLSLIINWYWLFLPFILFPFFKNAWLWWRRELWEKQQKYGFIEMVFPGEVSKPIASMEHILTSLWSIYSGIEGIRKIKKKWWQGKKLEHFCIEIISNGPHQRYFIRANRKRLEGIKSLFYSQYPTLEFLEVKRDYTDEVTWNIPNKDWDLGGFDLALKNKDAFPIKTYSQFFETKPESIKEEKRIDPMSLLIENLSSLKDEEKIWIQMKFAPVTNKDVDFFSQGRAVIDKLVHRKGDKLKQGFFAAMFDQIFYGKNEEKKEELIPSEMKLTPREREIVFEVEKKLGKKVFKTHIRGIYFGERSIFNDSRKSLIESFFSSFALPDQNEFSKVGKTKTKIELFLIKRRLFIRKRKLFRKYVLRENPLFPKEGGNCILSTEEIATIFHLPIELHKYSADISRIRSTKGSAPESLPV